MTRGPRASDHFDRLHRATRMALFETGWADHEYATPGGTVFIVTVDGKPYGITAYHVPRGFDWEQLVVLDRKYGEKIAGLKSVSHATKLIKDAEGTDIGDLAVIEFVPEMDAYFFGDDIYPLDETTVARADINDALTAYCCLKETTTILDQVIAPSFASLGYVDDGPHTYDPFLRTCIGKWSAPEFTSVSGLSGCPVFNDTKDALSGMMIRGGLTGEDANGLFLDIEDVLRIVRCVSTGETSTDYVKTVRHPKRT